MQHSQHERTQNLLLISKLLDGRDNTSPFTLLLDSIEQSSWPVISRYVSKAQSISTKVVYVSFETFRPPHGTTQFIRADMADLQNLQGKIISACAALPKALLILDTLHPLFGTKMIPNPAAWLSSLISPNTHLLAVYHSSQPLSSSVSFETSYQPHPLTLLRYLATTILKTHSLSHMIDAKAARDRSRAAPVHGLEEDEEGTIQGLGANDPRGVVVECEMRRKSGRAVELWFVLDPIMGNKESKHKVAAMENRKKDPFAGITLLDEHPLYRKTFAKEDVSEPKGDESEHGEVTFNLGLTERQRKEREGVVLPYFDAQRPDGGGEGGRILYDMGSEDDFDDEEDEI